MNNVLKAGQDVALVCYGECLLLQGGYGKTTIQASQLAASHNHCLTFKQTQAVTIRIGHEHVYTDVITHKARCKEKASHFSKANLIDKNHKHAFGLQNRLSLYLAKSS